jgi:hypothetical protein
MGIKINPFRSIQTSDFLPKNDKINDYDRSKSRTRK